MEELSQTVNVESTHKKNKSEASLSNNTRREKSQWSVFQLYMVCAEKVMGLSMSQNQELAGICI